MDSMPSENGLGLQGFTGDVDDDGNPTGNYVIIVDDETPNKKQEPERKEEPASPGNPQQALAEIVGDTWQDYMVGLLTSSATDMLLKEYMIADKDAAFWTLGCRSRDWYRFNGKFWGKSVKPPSDDSIPQPEEMEQLTDKIKHTILAIFKSGESFLPEMVADLWEAPELEGQQKNLKVEALPDMLELFCANCNAQLEDNPKFCISCGTKVIDKPVKPTYPGCGGEISEGLNFCTNCGQKL